MSLVGSLEDLGLGEILQIVSLSGKSGVLLIRSRDGEGRVVFRSGLIRGAFAKDGPRDLAELVAARGALPADQLTALQDEAQAEGSPLEALLAARTRLDASRIDELRERHVEATVLRMFSWRTGEFSFEIRDEPADGDSDEMLLRAGLNAQFLALEGTRLRDECNRSAAETNAPTAADDPLDDEGPVEMQITVLELVDGELEDGALPDALEAGEGPSLDDEPTLSGAASAAASERAKDEPAAPAPPAQPTRPLRPLEDCAIIAIDRELAALEWIKRALASCSARVHIFQRSEQGIARIRQYLARGECPLVVLTTGTPPDPVSGARDWSEIAARLRAQVPSLPIVLLAASGAPVVPVSECAIPDALATRPDLTVLSDERARERRESLGSELRGALERARGKSGAPRAARADAGDALRGLREMSARLRDPSSRGDILRLVIDYAARSFERVAIFMVRDGEAQGVAQVGLAAAGGPDDVDLRKMRFPADEPAWFRKVAESRAPLRSAPEEEGDRDLASRLGRQLPDEVYVAPIESGERLAAVLYADNLPSRRPLPDTSAIEVVLHEAGLALERAVLERALEEAEGERTPAPPQEPSGPGR